MFMERFERSVSLVYRYARCDMAQAALKRRPLRNADKVEAKRIDLRREKPAYGGFKLSRDLPIEQESG
jgi:hypothetical protein